jgi:2-amino-4-hydroxy-6-hydroxymethyldihydropteridine diphosphokinase
MSIAILSVGSNINPESNISEMLVLLGQFVTILKESPMVRTKPVGIVNQPDFLNGAVKIETGLEIKDLEKLLKSIEDKLGRDRTLPKFGPRTIDIDIVVWNNKIIDNDYYTRDFLKSSVDFLQD